MNDEEVTVVNVEDKVDRKKKPKFNGWLSFWIVIIIGAILLLGFRVKYLIENEPPFYEKHEEPVAMLREHFGEETKVYPSRKGNPYFFITPDEELRAATFWGFSEFQDLDFESELLEEPYITERHEKLYQEFIYARRFNSRLNSTIND